MTLSHTFAPSHTSILHPPTHSHARTHALHFSRSLRLSSVTNSPLISPLLHLHIFHFRRIFSLSFSLSFLLSLSLCRNCFGNIQVLLLICSEGEEHHHLLQIIIFYWQGQFFITSFLFSFSNYKKYHLILNVIILLEMFILTLSSFDVVTNKSFSKNRNYLQTFFDRNCVTFIESNSVEFDQVHKNTSLKITFKP